MLSTQPRKLLESEVKGVIVVMGVVGMVVSAISVSVAVVVTAVFVVVGAVVAVVSAIVVVAVVAVVSGIVAVIVRPRNFGLEIVASVAASAAVVSATGIRVAVWRVPTATSTHWRVHRWAIWSW